VYYSCHGIFIFYICRTPIIPKRLFIVHSLQVRERQEDSLVVRSPELPDAVGVVVVVVGVVGAGEGTGAGQRASAGDD